MTNSTIFNLNFTQFYFDLACDVLPFTPQLRNLIPGVQELKCIYLLIRILNKSYYHTYSAVQNIVHKIPYRHTWLEGRASAKVFCNTKHGMCTLG